MHLLPNNVWFRKALLLAFLAIAGLLAAEVFQLITNPAPEDILKRLGAQQVLTQGLTVNGVAVVAHLWQLPAYASVEPLRKARGKLLTVGKMVYVFEDDMGKLKGQCVYPDDLPRLEISCDYVMELRHSRFVSGTTSARRADVMAAGASAATAQRWKCLSEGVWQKGKETLFLSAVELQHETQVALMVTKDAQ
ncbi:MAG: hypothetical protein RR133_05015 [Kiritimatiellia bacterium]